MSVEIRTLHTSKRRAALSMAVSALLIAMGVFLLCMGNGFGWVVLVFFGLLFLVSVMMMLPNSTYLKLRDDGFEMRSLFRSYFFPWADVKEFGVYQMRHYQSVGFNYNESYTAQAKSRRFNSRLMGYEGGLTDTYGLKPQELADLMNACLMKYGGKTPGG